MPSPWVTFPCPTMQARWRYLDDGRIEVEEIGVPTKKAWPPGVDQWKTAIYQNSAKYNVPAHWIAGIVSIEDPAGDPIAVSSAGAIGVMQIMPGTGAAIAKGLGRSFSPSDLYDPLLNIELGTAHFAGLVKRYKGDFVSAAVAYNAGSVICLSPATKCQKGYWGICTDGSAYPLIAIQGANTALGHGYPPTAPLPPLLEPPAPWAIVASSAVGAFLGYLAAKEALQTAKKARVFGTSRRARALGLA